MPKIEVWLALTEPAPLAAPAERGAEGPVFIPAEQSAFGHPQSLLQQAQEQGWKTRLDGCLRRVVNDLADVPEPPGSCLRVFFWELAGSLQPTKLVGETSIFVQGGVLAIVALNLAQLREMHSRIRAGEPPEKVYTPTGQAPFARPAPVPAGLNA